LKRILSTEQKDQIFFAAVITIHGQDGKHYS